MTASTLCQPPSSRRTGIPPPPAATTTAPVPSSVRIWSASTIRRGRGLGTTRRKTPVEVSVTVQPCSVTSRATAAVICEPIGFVGDANAGSSRSTSAWVRTATARADNPRRARALSIATARMCPMPPCESATASHRGSSGRPSISASAATSSPRRRMNPTCGPLPWVTSTCQSSAIRSATCSANVAARSCWRGIEPGSPSRTRALPPMATSAVRLIRCPVLRPSRASARGCCPRGPVGTRGRLGREGPPWARDEG